MKKTLLLLFILVGMYGYGQVVAVPDTFTVLQGNVDTFDLGQNDTFPAGDSVCISLLDSNARFTLIDCRRLRYSAASEYAGLDTVRYAICDTSLNCDTGAVVIIITADSSLWPYAYFVEDSSRINGSPYIRGMFSCTRVGYGLISGYQDHILLNRSAGADSTKWQIHAFYQYPPFDTTYYRYGDSLVYLPTANDYPHGSYHGPIHIEVCIIASNEYGTSSYCDTSCDFVYEGISEVALAQIKLYPTPADKLLTIDMEQNTDAITAQYSSIDLINMLGQKVKSISRSSNSKTVHINVTDLPEGINNATITDAAGTTRALGRFTIAR